MFLILLYCHLLNNVFSCFCLFLFLPLSFSSLSTSENNTGGLGPGGLLLATLPLILAPMLSYLFTPMVIPVTATIAAGRRRRSTNNRKNAGGMKSNILRGIDFHSESNSNSKKERLVKAQELLKQSLQRFAWNNTLGKKSWLNFIRWKVTERVKILKGLWRRKCVQDHKMTQYWSTNSTRVVQEKALLCEDRLKGKKTNNQQDLFVCWNKINRIIQERTTRMDETSHKLIKDKRVIEVDNDVVFTRVIFMTSQ